MPAEVALLNLVKRVGRSAVRWYLHRSWPNFGKSLVGNWFVDSYAVSQRIVSPTYFGARVECNMQDLIQQRIHFFGIWEPNLSHWIEDTLVSGDLFIGRPAYRSGQPLVELACGIRPADSPRIHRCRSQFHSCRHCHV